MSQDVGVATLAAAAGRCDVLHVALHKDPSVIDSQSVLSAAAKGDRHEVLIWLVRSGARLDRLLHTACCTGSVRAVAYLCNVGARPDIDDMRAAIGRDTSGIARLLAGRECPIDRQCVSRAAKLHGVRTAQILDQWMRRADAACDDVVQDAAAAPTVPHLTFQHTTPGDRGQIDVRRHTVLNAPRNVRERSNAIC